jgi:hypothetical protein
MRAWYYMLENGVPTGGDYGSCQVSLGFIIIIIIALGVFCYLKKVPEPPPTLKKVLEATSIKKKASFCG